MNSELQEKCARLRTWTKALALAVEDVLPQMEQVLEGESKLPESCPSKESMAVLQLGQIEKRLSEVVSAVHEIRKALLS